MVKVETALEIVGDVAVAVVGEDITGVVVYDEEARVAHQMMNARSHYSNDYLVDGSSSMLAYYSHCHPRPKQLSSVNCSSKPA